MIKRTATFNSPANYSLIEKAAIAAQFQAPSFENQRNGTPMSTSDITVDGNEYVLGAFSTFSFPVASSTFAADFTIEAKVTFLAPPTAPESKIWMAVLAQYNGLFTDAQSSWAVSYRLDTNTLVLNISSIVALTGQVVLEFGKEYHFVVERMGTAVTVTVNGQIVITGTASGALRTTTVPVMSHTDPALLTGTCPRRYRDIRIANRALYRGVIIPNIKDFGIPSWASQVTFDPSTLDEKIGYGGNGIVSAASVTTAVVDGRRVISMPTSATIVDQGPIFNPTSPFTCSLTVKCPSGRNFYIGAHVATSNRAVFGVWDSNTSAFAIWNNSTNPRTSWPISTPATQEFETWVFAYDGTRFFVYLNGALHSSFNFTFTNTVTPTTMRIGSRNLMHVAEFKFNPGFNPPV